MLQLWTCGGGPGVPIRYGYGYWTGPDGDLLCVIDDVDYVEYALSPISRFRIVAFLHFFLKRFWLLSKSRLEVQVTDRLCCCIPDQTKLDERCQRLAVYQIWFGDNPTTANCTESYAEHLEQMLDDNVRFEILRIPRAI